MVKLDLAGEKTEAALITNHRWYSRVSFKIDHGTIDGRCELGTCQIHALFGTELTH